MEQRGRKISASRGAPMVNVTPLAVVFYNVSLVTFVAFYIFYDVSLSHVSWFQFCVYSRTKQRIEAKK